MHSLFSSPLWHRELQICFAFTQLQFLHSPLQLHFKTACPWPTDKSLMASLTLIIVLSTLSLLKSIFRFDRIKPSTSNTLLQQDFTDKNHDCKHTVFTSIFSISTDYQYWCEFIYCTMAYQFIQ